MTIGQLVECLTGKVAALSGHEGDATAFNTAITVESVASQLHRKGYQRHGNETLHSGMTGKQLSAKMFIGPTFYQRLKHLVDDKIHSRARGKVSSCRRPQLLHLWVTNDTLSLFGTGGESDPSAFGGPCKRRWLTDGRDGA